MIDDIAPPSSTSSPSPTPTAPLLLLLFLRRPLLSFDEVDGQSQLVEQDGLTPVRLLDQIKSNHRSVGRGGCYKDMR